MSDNISTNSNSAIPFAPVADQPGLSLNQQQIYKMVEGFVKAGVSDDKIRAALRGSGISEQLRKQLGPALRAAKDFSTEEIEHYRDWGHPADVAEYQISWPSISVATGTPVAELAALEGGIRNMLMQMQLPASIGAAVVTQGLQDGAQFAAVSHDPHQTKAWVAREEARLREAVGAENFVSAIHALRAACDALHVSDHATAEKLSRLGFWNSSRLAAQLFRQTERQLHAADLAKTNPKGRRL